MLNDKQKKDISDLAIENLKHAENIWNEVGSDLVVSLSETATMDSVRKYESLPSNIPGHSLISENNPKVETYIALVADIRDSSKHLMHRISERETKVNQLQRVYYETSALLPALAQTVKYEKGVVTEYLGDGVLSLFLVPNSEDEKERAAVLYASRRASINCIDDTRNIVNNILRDRYNLPALNIGVGLSMSTALVTLVGLKGEKQAKVIGECVYRATKLSSGNNKIIVDESIEQAWPTSKGGKVRFVRTTLRGVDGYELNRTLE